jgi:hypothetical protein
MLALSATLPRDCFSSCCLSSGLMRSSTPLASSHRSRMPSHRGECDMASMPMASAVAGSTAAANTGRQPQPAESNAKSSR